VAVATRGNGPGSKSGCDAEFGPGIVAVMDAPAERYRDESRTLSLFALAGRGIDVVCPRCRGHARVVVRPGDDPSGRWPSRRLSCTGCGHCADWTTRRTTWGEPVDPFFGLPLWLLARCRGTGQVLWALNLAHLDLLAAFVGARLRERGHVPAVNSTMVERLPTWLKVRGNRAEILRAVARLRASLPADDSRDQRGGLPIYTATPATAAGSPAPVTDSQRCS
jgi:hypothetical protein